MNTNKYYMQIVQTILRQEDAETKNPIDVGIECGYPEEDVREAIELLKDMEKRRDNEVVQVIVHRQILEVNTYDMTIKLVEELKDVGFNEKVKNNIYVCTTEGKLIARWKYLKTGKKGEYKSGKPIIGISIVNQDIILLLKDKIVKIKETGEQKELCLVGLNESKFYALKEIERHIYIINNHIILRVDNEFENVECIVRSSGVIVAVYSKNRKDFGYVVEDAGQRKCYTENGNIDKNIFSKEALDNLLRSEVAELVETKNYYCFGDMLCINKKDNQEMKLGKMSDEGMYGAIMFGDLINEVFDLYNNFPNSQISSVYSQDKIVYIKEYSKIVIMDLKNGYTNYVVMP